MARSVGSSVMVCVMLPPPTPQHIVRWCVLYQCGVWCVVCASCRSAYGSPIGASTAPPRSPTCVLRVLCVSLIPHMCISGLCEAVSSRGPTRVIMICRRNRPTRDRPSDAPDRLRRRDAHAPSAGGIAAGALRAATSSAARCAAATRLLLAFARRCEQ